MARGKLPARDEFHDSGYRFRRLKRGEAGKAFSILVHMPADDDHDGWWWSKPRKVMLDKPNDKTQLLSLADAYREELAAEVTAPMTMSVYIEHWKDRRKKLVTTREENGKTIQRTLKQSTLDREKTILQHIDDYLGDLPLSDITAADIEDAYLSMANDGMSMSTRARVHMKLGQLMDQAIRDRFVDENPVEDVASDAVPHMPQRDTTRHEERRVTIEEADKLMSDIQAEPRDGLHAAIWLAYTMGLRRGECLGLKWSDINEAAMKVHIQRQMTRKGIDTTKTYKSTRTLPLEGPVWRYLDEWRKDQKRLYEKPLPIRDKRGRVKDTSKKEWTPEAFVCTNVDGWEWRPNGNFNRGLRNFFVAHGLGEWIVDDEEKRHYHGATLHSLRHTYATSLIREGVDVVSAKELLGHAQITTTLQIYADATEEGLREAARKHASHVATEWDTGLYTEEDQLGYEEWNAAEEERRESL